MNSFSVSRRFTAAMYALEAASRGLSTRERLLIQVTASRINGCRFCLRMHSDEAKSKGISLEPQSDRERIIVRFTEMATRLGDDVDSSLIDDTASALGAKDYADVVAAVAAINAWNRIGILCKR